MAVKPIPEGHHSVNPYLLVAGATDVLAFVTSAFGAKELDRSTLPDGTIMHASVRIGDSVVMMGEASAKFPAMPCSLYLYVEDVDTTYRRALGAGGQSIMEPANQFYGDRSACVRDKAGNCWWIATHVEDVAPEEMKRREQEYLRKQSDGGAGA